MGGRTKGRNPFSTLPKTAFLERSYRFIDSGVQSSVILVGWILLLARASPTLAIVIIMVIVRQRFIAFRPDTESLATTTVAPFGALVRLLVPPHACLACGPVTDTFIPALRIRHQFRFVKYFRFSDGLFTLVSHVFRTCLISIKRLLHNKCVEFRKY